ncbi:MAG: hypothetical protein WHT65_01945 [Pseudothermotoga sp.]
MTSAGMAVVSFLVCFAVFLVLLYATTDRDEFFVVNPFPRVVVSSPVEELMKELRVITEQIILYRKALSMGQKVTVNIPFRSSIIRVQSLIAYEEMLNEATRKTGTKPDEKRIYLKNNYYEYLIYASFTYKDVIFLYKPRITLTDSGYALRDHSDVAKVIFMALNGEGPDLNSEQSDEKLIASLILFSQKYGVEVVETR